MGDAVRQEPRRSPACDHRREFPGVPIRARANVTRSGPARPIRHARRCWPSVLTCRRAATARSSNIRRCHGMATGRGHAGGRSRADRLQASVWRPRGATERSAQPQLGRRSRPRWTARCPPDPLVKLGSMAAMHHRGRPTRSPRLSGPADSLTDSPAMLAGETDRSCNYRPPGRLASDKVPSRVTRPLHRSLERGCLGCWGAGLGTRPSDEQEASPSVSLGAPRPAPTAPALRASLQASAHRSGLGAPREHRALFRDKFYQTLAFGWNLHYNEQRSELSPSGLARLRQLMRQAHEFRMRIEVATCLAANGQVAGTGPVGARPSVSRRQPSHLRLAPPAEAVLSAPRFVFRQPHRNALDESIEPRSRPFIKTHGLSETTR